MTLIQLNNNIKKIVIVYQLEFVNKNSPGLGDFLRGCFFIRQLSKVLNIDFDLDISNHPISNYIINNGKNESIDYNNINWIEGINRPDPGMLKFLDNPPNNRYFDTNFVNQIITEMNKTGTHVFPLFTNSFPIFYNFTDEGREFMKSRLLPNDVMNKYIDDSLHRLTLNKKSYGVIHIRTGDNSITNKTVEVSIINKIKKIIHKIINPQKNYLIISDNNCVKLIFNNINNCHFNITKVEHLGGQHNTNKNMDGIKNTLLDFYLMSYSNSILSISIYDHISGFSKYCSEIYNIPFVNIKI
jgi:hypothetical protein